MQLFKEFVYPFELTSFLILVAILGAIVLAQRDARKANMVPTNYYLILSAILFGLGVVAFIFKRNIITIFMSIELMLNAVNLAFVAFSQASAPVDGQVFVLFVIVVAAAEAAVGLGIIILIQRATGNRSTSSAWTCSNSNARYSINLWIIPLLPLLGSADQRLARRKWPNKIVNSVAVGSTGLSFACALEAVREFSQCRPNRFLRQAVFHLDLRGHIPRGL